jgi:choice-of-anchor A domain-containing protein
VFSAAPVGNVAVWDLTTTELNDAKTNLSISGLPSTDTGVVNVTCPTAGCNFTTNQTWSTLAALKNVVFDFENTANVSVDNQWETSIFALDSEVFNSAPIEGTLVAESYVGSAELHDFPLSLCTPGTPGCFLNPPAVIPEPGSLAVLGSAIVAFVAVGRRRWW